MEVNMSNSYYKEIFCLCLLLNCAGLGHAQKLRLNGYGSYVLDGMYHIYYENGDVYKGNINHGLQLGLGIEYMVKPSYGVEFNFFRRNTNVFQEAAPVTDRISTDLRFSYFLLGINAYPQTSGKIQVFGSGSSGIITQFACRSNSIQDSTGKNSITKFAWAARVGGI